MKALAPGPAAASGEGTQAIRRAAGLLRAIAKVGAEGGSLADLARDQQLPRSTVHRILSCLEDEGLVERTAGSRRYGMGPLLHELGLTSSTSLRDVVRWHPVVDSVARQTGVTTYLMRRSGVEAVCLIKVDGHGVVRFVPVEVGQRRLLGVGAGATALLAGLDAAQREVVIGHIEPGLRNYPRLNADSLVRLAIRPVGMATYADNKLRIPSLEVNENGNVRVLSNVVLTLTDATNWLFTLESFQP